MSAKKSIYGVFLVLLLNSCYKDKGNYQYHDINDITISEIPERIDVLGNLDTLKISPKVVSSLDGTIQNNDANYHFTYSVSGSVKAGDISYVALDSTYPKDLNYLVKLTPKLYDASFIVTDKRTGVQTMKPFKLNVASGVTEGWMVLCNEGASERVRLDMITVVSPTRSLQAFDLGSSIGLPAITKGKKLSFLYQNATDSRTHILTKADGGYRLANSNLSTGASMNMIYEFGNKNANCKPQNLQGVYSASHIVTVDGDNDVYAMGYNAAGPIFEFPVNTSKGNRVPEFKVSEYIVSDPKPRNGSNSVLGYDMTNKRFVDWSSGRKTMMSPLVNPQSAALFDYVTGKNMVFMGSTLYGNSTAYAILEKDGKYSLYGITFITASPIGKFEQSHYADLNIPDIDKATSFAFHSSLPYMFYAVGSKLYQYDIVAKSTKLMKDFSGASISMLKFNLFRFNVVGRDQAYWDQQYQLIVGLEDKSLPEKTCGMIHFYDVPPLNAPLTLAKEYKGFAKVIDVTYKEVTVYTP